MRKLTVTRKKAFPACLSPMSVYLEDPIFGDTTVSGYKCKRIGTLKNGESKRFDILEGSRRLFVVSERMKELPTESFCVIPAGKENVFVSGKNRCKPDHGNPFYFDTAE